MSLQPYRVIPAHAGILRDVMWEIPGQTQDDKCATHSHIQSAVPSKQLLLFSWFCLFLHVHFLYLCLGEKAWDE